MTTLWLPPLRMMMMMIREMNLAAWTLPLPFQSGCGGEACGFSRAGRRGGGASGAWLLHPTGCNQVQERKSFLTALSGTLFTREGDVSFSVSLILILVSPPSNIPLQQGLGRAPAPRSRPTGARPAAAAPRPSPNAPPPPPRPAPSPAG